MTTNANGLRLEADIPFKAALRGSVTTTAKVAPKAVNIPNVLSNGNTIPTQGLPEKPETTTYGPLIGWKPQQATASSSALRKDEVKMTVFS
jgi:hypothetical protein